MAENTARRMAERATELIELASALADVVQALSTLVK